MLIQSDTRVRSFSRLLLVCLRLFYCLNSTDLHKYTDCYYLAHLLSCGFQDYSRVSSENFNTRSLTKSKKGGIMSSELLLIGRDSAQSVYGNLTVIEETGMIHDWKQHTFLCRRFLVPLFTVNCPKRAKYIKKKEVAMGLWTCCCPEAEVIWTAHKHGWVCIKRDTSH